MFLLGKVKLDLYWIKKIKVLNISGKARLYNFFHFIH
jgi:hypothetical protein